MYEHWEGCEAELTREAIRDLLEVGEVRPCLVTFRGNEPLFVAWLRPFPPGGYHRPLLELFAAAAPLGADRLALLLAGRAWSTSDPVPPVVPGVGDLRQRTLVITRVDAHDTPEPVVTSTIVPFDLEDEEVLVRESLILDGGEGWVPAALTAIASGRAEMHASEPEIAGQIERCVLLGHLVAVHDRIRERLGLKAA